MFKPLFTILTEYSDACQNFHIIPEVTLGECSESYTLIPKNSPPGVPYSVVGIVLFQGLIYINHVKPDISLSTTVIDLADAKCCEKVWEQITVLSSFEY